MGDLEVLLSIRSQMLQSNSECTLIELCIERLSDISTTSLVEDMLDVPRTPPLSWHSPLSRPEPTIMVHWTCFADARLGYGANCVMNHEAAGAPQLDENEPGTTVPPREGEAPRERIGLLK